MNEFKGTKGKWEVNPRALRNVKCNGLTVANCSAGQSGDKESEEIANAQLISCAPEMLEMIKLLVDRMEENDLGQFSAVERAKKLIEKVTKS